MNIYRVSCFSDCGSYFVSYLQSVTVKAESESQAKEVVKKWLSDNGKNFIYSEDKWEVELVSSKGEIPCVIDWIEESDY